ncbi:MAG TPA: DotA/TraY family protein [Gammaproteobacteria bacterium]|nr:DotA/TraY family protein [Gammaproteobacteria bacterium]
MGKKLKLAKKIFILLIGSFYTLSARVAFAFDISWQADPEDKSIEYLGHIFGKVGTVLQGTGSPLFGNLFSIFNTAIIFLGTIVVMYTASAAVLETAHEGEVLGKKWSAAWIPIRTALGVSFLLPTPGGYSILQIALMTVALQGVHAGNAIYRVLLDTVGSGVGLTKTNIVESESNDTSLGALPLFNSLVCMEYINNNAKNLVGGRDVSVYTYQGHVYVGVPDTQYSTICGGLSPGTKSMYVSSETIWHGIQETAGISAAAAMLPYAQEAVLLEGQPESFTGSGVIASGRNLINNTVANAPLDVSRNQALQETLKNAKRDGWIFAGSLYFKLIDPTPPEASGPKTLYAPNKLDFDKNAAPTLNWNKINSITSAYLTVTDLGGIETPRARINLGASSALSGNAYALFKPFTNLLQKLALQVTENLMAPTDPNEEPLVAMAKLGGNIVNFTEIAFFTVVAAAIAVALVGCIASGASPICFVVLALISLMSIVVNFLLSVLWVAGISLALYVPLIPYLVFTFTAISWFLMIIESMVAAPIIALALIAPAGDFLGKASPAVLLMTNIFLRPALMIVGFVAGSKLLIAILRMFNFSFSGTVVASQSYIGFFGIIVLVVLYCGLAIMMVHESFSLIYVIPDKILRWIGGQTEQSIAARRVPELEAEYVEQGAEIGKDVMKGAMSFAVDKAKQKVAKQKEKEAMMKDMIMKGGGGGGGGMGA